jgi:hypothetical protein
MPINTFHRAEMLDQLKLAAIEKQQSLEESRQDSISEFESVQQNISQTRQNARANEMQIYYQNVESQSNARSELNKGFDTLAAARIRIKYLRSKERLQSRKITNFTLMKKRYKEIKAEEIKQQQLDSQNRQAEVFNEAKKLVGNILPFRQKSNKELAQATKNTI